MTDDDGMIEELRRIARTVDPVPDEVTAYARAALGWRRVDAELAELLADSRLESGALARSEGGAVRALHFRADEFEIDVEVQDVDDGFALLGQLAPATEAEIEVQRDDGTVVAAGASDSLGRFRLTFGGGRVRLAVRRPPPAPPVETSWFDV